MAQHSVVRAASAFTLAEVMIGIALAAIVILSLGALGISALKANRKSTDSVLGQWVVQREVERLVYDAQTLPTSPVWSNSSLSSAPTTLLNTTINSSNIDFKVVITSSDIDPTSFPAPHRFRQIKGTATWWGGDQGPRQGMGQLRAESTAYVHEP